MKSQRHPPKLTLRLRLTMLYAALMVVAGTVLVTLTYVFVDSQLPQIDQDSIKPVRRVLLTGNVPFGTTQQNQVIEQMLTQQAEARDATMSSLLTYSVIALAGVTLVALAMSWLLAGRALAPIHRITDTARRVADRSLHERIEVKGPRDEISELGQTFNAMLERLDRSFDGQRRFAGNAAHELRTPLTINRTLLEVALARTDASPDLRSLGETMLAVNDRHHRLIDGLLLLSRSDNELTRRAPVDLASIAQHLAPEPSPESPVDVRLDLRPAMVSGDAVLLERLVQNLLDNALLYNLPTRGWVSVQTRLNTLPGPIAHSELVVSNTGPGVAAYEVDGFFEPFRRGGAGDRMRSDRGVGLGLSIVRSVARAHGGDARAEPREGGGLIVTVSIPALLPGPPPG